MNVIFKLLSFVFVLSLGSTFSWACTGDYQCNPGEKCMKYAGSREGQCLDIGRRNVYGSDPAEKNDFGLQQPCEGGAVSGCPIGYRCSAHVGNRGVCQKI